MSPEARFPPTQLLSRDHLAEAAERFGRVERLYHIGQAHAWDGRRVLGEALEKHGGVQASAERRADLARVFSVILWGELAAWNVAAQLADRLEDVEAKMAATSQAFDEARHFYVMRDYLRALDVELPPIDRFTQTALNEILDAPDATAKLLGMQLIVESVALTLFRAVSRGNAEPVLVELMPYFERDEARHVGLGALYLPRLLEQLSLRERARLATFQVRVNTLMGWSAVHLGEPFTRLGVDANRGMRETIRRQSQLLAEMNERHGPRGTQGIVWTPRALHVFNSWYIDLFFPPPGAEQPDWQRGGQKVLRGVARVAEALLA